MLGEQTRDRLTRIGSCVDDFRQLGRGDYAEDIHREITGAERSEGGTRPALGYASRTHSQLLALVSSTMWLGEYQQYA